MKIFATILGIVLTGAALASPPPWRSDERQQSIWNAAHNRFVDQLDYWFEDGDYPRCIQLLRVLSDLEPENYHLATDLGYLLESIEEHDEALAVYVRLRKDNPKDPDATFPEANFYFKKKIYAKVPALLEPSIMMKPHANSFRILGHSYERMGLLMEAKRVWTAYLAANPNDDPARNNLRRINDKIGAPKR